MSFVKQGNPPPPTSKRPRCQNCNEPLRPWYETVKTERVHTSQGFSYVNYTEWRGDYHRYGHFCTLRCGVSFANDVVDRRIAKAKAAA